MIDFFMRAIADARQAYDAHLATRLAYEQNVAEQYQDFARQLMFEIRTHPWGYYNKYGSKLTIEEVQQALEISKFHRRQAERLAHRLRVSAAVRPTPEIVFECCVPSLS